MSNLNPLEPVLFSERVWPNFGTFAATTALLPAITLVSEPFDFRIGLVIGIVLVFGIWLALLFFAPVIQVTQTYFLAGKARIPRALLGKIQEVSKENIFYERGPGLNPASYKVFQGTVKTAIKLEVNDPEDPTPYWILSTRKPAQLAKVLNATV